MRSIERMTLSFLVCALLAACSTVPTAGTPGRNGAEAGDRAGLERFVQSRLAPYLIEQLGSHPRFRDQPLVLLAVKDDHIQAQIDDLTRDLRRKLREALTGSAHINLIWRQPLPSWPGYSHFDQVPCAPLQPVRFVIGIDLRPDPASRKMSLAVRALDRLQRCRVAGFGLAWHGEATAAELQAVMRRAPDEQLRGSRLLPLDGCALKPAAAHLAHRISCLLLQRETDRAATAIEAAGAEIFPRLPALVSAVRNHVGSFVQVTLVDSAADADSPDVIVRIEARRIDDDLIELRTKARFQASGRILEDANPLFLRPCPKPAVPIQPSKPSTAVNQPRPSTRPAPRPPQPATAVNPPASMPVATALIRSFRLITPQAPSFCATDTPWLLGSRTIADGEHLPHGLCLALKVKLSRPAYLFVVDQNSSGRVALLTPSSPSAAAGTALVTGRPHRRFRFPGKQEGLDSVLELVGEPGPEAVTLVAICDRMRATRFLIELRTLILTQTEGRSGGMNQAILDAPRGAFPNAQTDSLQALFTRWEARAGRGFDRRSIRFIHEPPQSQWDVRIPEHHAPVQGAGFIPARQKRCYGEVLGWNRSIWVEARSA